MKRSGGTVVHGFEKQLEFYKTASQTDLAVFVVIDYGDMGNKLNEIRRIRDERLNKGERASEIAVIDATRKASAKKSERVAPVKKSWLYPTSARRSCNKLAPSIT